MKCLLLLLAILGVGNATRMIAEETIFSGPQTGEKLEAFKVRGVFGEEAGKELDFVTQAQGKPIVLIFVHGVTRPSISLTRALSHYTVSRASDGLSTGIVWLNDDLTEAENELKKIQHALTPKAPTGISVDGREGPGSYGLNRHAMLTVLVANQGKVTANFALVQPSLQSDLPKIFKSIVDIIGGSVPNLDTLPGMPGTMQRGAKADGKR